MLLRIVDDINRALDNDAYFAALSLALTLPDVCGKAEYPNESNGKRYIKWYDEYVGKYEQCPCKECQTNKMPYLSGEVVYSLRNSLLHQWTPNIDSKKIKNEANQVDEFTLIIEKKNEGDIYLDESGVTRSFMGDFCIGIKRTYRVSVRRLCLILELTAKGYYQKNRDKFDFFNFSIIDWEEEIVKT